MTLLFVAYPEDDEPAVPASLGILAGLGLSGPAVLLFALRRRKKV